MNDLNYIFYDTIDSTNTEAKRLIRAGKIDQDTVISALTQTAGRGRQGKDFYSPKDSGIYMSVILKDMGRIEDQVTVTTRTAVAVARAIFGVTGIEVGIKWVNDLYIDNRKIAGILCEAVNDYETDLLKYVIIGIGVNIYTSDFPEELSNIAGSLITENMQIKNHDILKDGPEKLRDSLIRSIADEVRGELRNSSIEKTYEEYRRLSNVLGKKIAFVRNGIRIEAFAADIDDIGGLIVEYKDRISGEIVKELLNSGEISIIL